ncbi:geranylgeranyl diphosphate synthase IdsB [Mycobacterium heidelbergense]|uniref:geranylgeranyl diphosphate synthase IdsB n=1 Tax=Mycobacterium heidelbergense TaxID=53376 RepID=UPI003CEEDFDB
MPRPHVASDARWDLLRRAQCECAPVLRTAVDWLGEPFETMAAYHLGWDVGGSSGKSIRAALVLGAAAACGDTSAAAPAAAAVELIHNFSLLHDDVMDQDATRRGRPTVWAVWGQTNAILLGDALHALASRVLADMLRPAVAVRAVLRLQSACVALCVGQFHDCAFETRPAITVDEYLRMAAGKTAELMGCACALGALSARADTETTSALEQFGYQLGLAFQIVDDVMGIWGDPKVTGKPVGNDLFRRKATLPVVAALNSDSEAGFELAQLYQSTAPMTVDDVARATELVEAAGGRQAAHRHIDERSRAAIAALPDRVRSEDLIALAQLVVDRDR